MSSLGVMFVTCGTQASPLPSRFVMTSKKAQTRDPEVVAFMEAILEKLGLKNAEELKTKLIRDGYMTSGQSRKVNRWVSGESSPMFHCAYPATRSRAVVSACVTRRSFGAVAGRASGVG